MSRREFVAATHRMPAFRHLRGQGCAVFDCLQGVDLDDPHEELLSIVTTYWGAWCVVCGCLRSVASFEGYAGGHVCYVCHVEYVKYCSRARVDCGPVAFAKFLAWVLLGNARSARVIRDQTGLQTDFKWGRQHLWGHDGERSRARLERKAIARQRRKWKKRARDNIRRHNLDKLEAAAVRLLVHCKTAEQEYFYQSRYFYSLINPMEWLYRVGWDLYLTLRQKRIIWARTSPAGRNIHEIVLLR